MSKLLIIFLLCTSGQTFAADKGLNGGNAEHSTTEEVANCLGLVSGMRICNGLGDTIFQGINVSLQSDALLPVRDPRARTILAKIMALPVFTWIQPVNGPGFMQLNKQFKLDVKKSEPCVENGEARDASMLTTGSGASFTATMCISESRLTRYPTAALNDQIPALYVHELSHAAGYDEDSAVYIQNYILKNWNLPCTAETWSTNEAQGKFTVEVYPMGDVDVIYSRYLKPQPGVFSDRNNTIEITTRNYPGDIVFSSTPAQGSMSFLSMNSDGTYTTESVAWGKILINGSETRDIFSSNVTVDGQNYPVQSVTTWDCNLR
jgi:hypothetical protein